MTFGILSLKSEFKITTNFTSSLLPATLTYLSEEPMGGVLMRAKMGSKDFRSNIGFKGAGAGA